MNYTKISTAFPSVRSLPDPTSIVTPAQWYLLMHIASPLIQYDHIKGHFKPLIASSWEIDGLTYRLQIDENARFSDGSKINAKDVAASVQRLIFLHSSTHFKLWDYIQDCNSVESPFTKCDGIRVIDDRTIEFTLVKRAESFFLFLSSPEGGIWPSKDIDPVTGALSYSRYSGPYAVKSKNDSMIVLIRNDYSLITQEFPNSANEIEIYISGCDPLELFREKKIDLFIEMTRPFSETAFLDLGLNRIASAFNTILYLFKVDGSKSKISQNFLTSLWQNNLGVEMAPADTFLPFGSLGMLNREAFLNSFPTMQTAPEINVAVPSPFFNEAFVSLLNNVSKISGSRIKFLPVSAEKCYALYDRSPKNPERFDFVLTPYVASERYPSVQITFLLEWRDIPIALDALDSPESSETRKNQLQTAQKWMLNEQIVVPLLFVRNHIISQQGIKLGDQPITDSEIHLWRVTK